MTQPPGWAPPGDDGSPLAPPPVPSSSPAVHEQAGAAYRAGYAPPQPPAPPAGLSITAFVLGLVGCLPLLSLAAIVVGVVALMRRQARRALAIAGILLGMFWIAVTVVFFASGAAGQLSRIVQDSVLEREDSPGGQDSVFDLGLGDCYNEPGGLAEDWDGTISIVDCAEPHEFEVYHETRMSHVRYPGDDNVYEIADYACYTTFAAFVGRAYSASSVDYLFWAPDEHSWADGDRIILCVATEGPDTRGSLAGSKR